MWAGSIVAVDKYFFSFSKWGKEFMSNNSQSIIIIVIN